MDFKEKKEIKDKRNEIKEMKDKINTNLKTIKDSVVYNTFYYILDDIDNNVSINKDSFFSIYDFSYPTYRESENYIINNMSFIDEIRFEIGFNQINLNDYMDSFKTFVDRLNTYVVNQLNIDNEIDLLDMDLDYASIENEYDYLDYIDYLDSIYNFYDNFNDCIVKFTENYNIT